MKLALLPRLDAARSGPASFQRRLKAGLVRRGHSTTWEANERGVDAVLVVAGTRRLGALLRAKARGVPVVHRLDGINWLHRLLPGSPIYRARAEARNVLMRFIRDRVADRIVYQSEFSRTLWEATAGVARAPARIIWNGVDLERFTPFGEGYDSDAELRLIAVESRFGPDRLALDVPLTLRRALGAERRVELLLVGEMPPAWRAELEPDPDVTVLGSLPADDIPYFQRGADLHVSAEMLSACPNAVIEALACGTPVVGFRTGALAELVEPDGGRVVPYGGDPWTLDPPDTPALVDAARDALETAGLAEGARRRAEQCLGLDSMIEAYLELFEELL